MLIVSLPTLTLLAEMAWLLPSPSTSLLVSICTVLEPIPLWARENFTTLPRLTPPAGLTAAKETLSAPDGSHRSILHLLFLIAPTQQNLLK